MNNPSLKFPKKWIFLRGLTRSSYHWFDFKENFKNKFKLDSIELPELPGNGYLSKLSTPKNLLDCVNELKKQTSTKEEPIGILGISLGGMLATQWAIDNQNIIDQNNKHNVSHLVLINSSFSLSPFYHRLRIQNYLKIILAAFSNNPEKIESFILNATSNTSNKNLVLQKCIDFQKKNPVHFKNLVQQLLLAKKSDFYIKPESNVLILSSENDRLVHTKCSQKIAKTWNCKIQSHPHAGHDLPLDDSDWVIEKINDHYFK